MRKTITFKEWLKEVICSGDITQNAAAEEIWRCTPDNGQDYRSLDLRFATIYHGRLYDLLTELWQMYEEHIDEQRK